MREALAAEVETEELCPASRRHGNGTLGHGAAVTSAILGFQYSLLDPPLPPTFNGVAPKATIIPVKDPVSVPASFYFGKRDPVFD